MLSAAPPLEMSFSAVFTPFPELQTARLALRRVTNADAADLLIMRSDPEVMRYIPRALARTEADVLTILDAIADKLDRGEGINWGITWKGSDTVIGMIGFVRTKPEHRRAEIGYSLSRAWHRQGIMREALAGVVQWGFEVMGLHSIEAIIDAENGASAALLEQSGFRREACFVEDFLHNGVFRNSVHYGLLRREWAGT